jgi:hypothetical protein
MPLSYGVNRMAAHYDNTSANTTNRALALVYAATIFTSAFLLFQIQPMISKAILPWFGGTPAVWTVCLLFFQSLLFAGYAYAHFTNAWLRPGQQAALHVVLLIAALALLNVLPSSTLQPRGDADPTRAILTILAVTIGLPYLVLSATGPLLQAWFAHSFPGRTPYRLYALSNVGSLLALLSYPFLFEREFDLTGQSRLWSAGFIAFAFLCAFAAWRVRKTSVGQAVLDHPPPLESVAGVEPHAASVPVEVSEPRAGHVLMWLLLPAFASIVLMATTNHISTDVAVVPLLWIVPLALYLLTFIIAFDRPTWYRPTTIAVLTLLAIYPASALYKNNNVGTIRLYKCGMTGRTIQTIANLFQKTSDKDLDDDADASESEGPHVKVGFRTALLVNFATMFCICLLCHGQLARLKPPTRYLTAYYLMMSAGGALGGIAVSLVAPHVFHTIFEWQLAIFTAAICAAGIILSAVVTRAVGRCTPHAPREGIHHATTRELSRTERGDYTPSLWPRYLLIALLFPFSFIFLDLTEYLFSRRAGAVYESRNFFGALTIKESDPADPADDELTLLNGTTIHGSQFVSNQLRGTPTTYYATTSGVGLVLNYFHANRPPGGVRIGDVGLGAGTLAAYALKFDSIRFYEINPTVIDISTSGKWFTYVSDCKKRGAHCDIKLGDARLSLQNEADSSSPPRSGEGPGEGQSTSRTEKILPYHVLVLDAFSGDAVPTHLLTAEAMDIYLPRIASEANMGVDGALLIHVSNRYLDLDRVARGAAQHIGFECLQIRSEANDAQSINSADWVVLTKNKALLAKLRPSATQPLPDDKPPVLWTDAHSSLFEILR